jgi:hypothetical protein
MHVKGCEKDLWNSYPHTGALERGQGDGLAIAFYSPIPEPGKALMQASTFGLLAVLSRVGRLRRCR